MAEAGEAAAVAAEVVIRRRRWWSGGGSGGGLTFFVNLAVGSTTPTTAKVIVTNSLPATTQLFYGTSTAYGMATVSSTLSLTTVYFNLAGLTPSTTYHLKAISLYGNQTVASPDLAFTPGSAAVATAPSGGTSSPPFTRTLTVGSTGADVTELQTLLVQWGYLTATPTGYFGNLTNAAVKRFQAASSISPVSGLVGPLTRAKLNALIGAGTASTATVTPPTATSTLSRTLFLGDQGPDVTQLQTILQQQGYFPLAPTGYFGALTQKAVQAFQCDQAIVCSGAPGTTGYGAVGPRTRGVLRGVGE